MPVIAIVSNYAFTTWNFRRNLLAQLHQTGHDILVIAPPDHTVPWLTALPGVQFIPIKHLDGGNLVPHKDLQLIFELRRVFVHHKPDLILLYTVKPNLYGNFAARMARIPTLSFVTGLGYTFMHSWLLKQTVSQIYRLTFRHTSGAVFHNHTDYNWFLNANLAPARKCHVIAGSGVDIRRFAYQPPVEKPHTEFLFAARMVRDKGLVEFIEAARMLKATGLPVVCRIIGDWHRVNPSVMERKAFDEAVSHGTIIYDGSVDDVVPYLRQADFIVLPSYREGLSKTLLESLSCGRPIITTDTPGCRELVPADNPTGWLVPIKDGQALFKTMKAAHATTKQQREVMARNGRRLIEEKYADAVIVKQYADLINAHLTV